MSGDAKDREREVKLRFEDLASLHFFVSHPKIITGKSEYFLGWGDNIFTMTERNIFVRFFLITFSYIFKQWCRFGRSIGENYMLVLSYSFLSKEWVFGHGLLLISWFRQVRKDTVGLQVELGLSGLEATLSVKGNGDKQSGRWMNDMDLERVIRVWSWNLGQLQWAT